MALKGVFSKIILNESSRGNQEGIRASSMPIRCDHHYGWFSSSRNQSQDIVTGNQWKISRQNQDTACCIDLCHDRCTLERSIQLGLTIFSNSPCPIIPCNGQSMWIAANDQYFFHFF